MTNNRYVDARTYEDLLLSLDIIRREFIDSGLSSAEWGKIVHDLNVYLNGLGKSNGLMHIYNKIFHKNDLVITDVIVGIDLNMRVETDGPLNAISFINSYDECVFRVVVSDKTYNEILELMNGK